MTQQPFLARPRDSGGAASLEEHLLRTRQLAEELGHGEKTIQQVIETAAILHDFGKLTEWFQSYIHAIDAGESVELTREQRKQKQHARISAYAVEYALSTLNIGTSLRACAFVAVAKHHQSLPNTRDAIQKSTNLTRKPNQKRFLLVKRQLKNIYQNASEQAEKLIETATENKGSLTDFVTYTEQRKTHATLDSFTVQEQTYETLLSLWGTLIAADKMAAAGLNIPSVSRHSPDLIESHINSFPRSTTDSKQQLNALREKARQGVAHRLSEFEQSETNLGTITLPTGFGKTLTGVQAALTLADEASRVVYAFPYTSILDQTDEVLQTALNVKPTEPGYTVHHHLSDTRTLPRSNVQRDTIDGDAAELLAETWHAPLVLTTFVQLFESLAGPTNSQGVKISSLQDAVVLLDEPQALPERWWRFIAWTVDLLNREFDTTVIFMTATQPRLLEYLPYTDNPFELVPDHTQYFDFLTHTPRVRYRLDDSVQRYLASPRTASGRPLTDAISEVASADDKHVLSVGNTVASVAEQGSQLLTRLDDAVSLNSCLESVYNEFTSAYAYHKQITDRLLEKVSVDSSTVVAMLTSRLRPLDRNILLSAIRRLLNSEIPIYVVSTQLIEAGVDVSFERVYRDFAPLPSLIQTAGRCNREFGDDISDVVVWRLESPEHGIATADIIYRDGYNLLSPTRETLQSMTNSSVISEQEMAVDASEAYFRRLHTDIKPGDRQLVKDGEQARFAALGDESLIPEKYPQAEVYVAVTENEQRLFDAYCTLTDNGRYRRLQTLRQAMQQRQISIPANATVLNHDVVSPFPDSEHMYYLDAKTDPEAYPLERGGVQ